MDIDKKQFEIVGRFQNLSNWEDRYKKIIETGRHLPAMPDELKTDVNKVKGCQSNVWMHAHLLEGRMIIQADSDASIVKGLIALLVELYSGQTPDAILKTSPEFLTTLGFNTHLSQTRVNGLASMMKQIKYYALAFQALSNRL